MWNLLVFAVIGLLAGAAARLFYPGRQPMRILGTLTVGIVGALVGGMISWSIWPAVDDQFHSGNLLMSVVAALMLIVCAAGLAYARGVSGSKTPSN